MKRTRQIFSVLLTLAMLLTLVPATVSAAEPEWETVNTFEELQEAVKNKQGHIKLGQNIDTKRLRKEESMNYNVTIKTIPARYAATVHMTIPRYEDEGLVWSILMSETAHMNLIEADPCLCAVTFLDGEYKEKNVEVMAWKTVKGELSRH